jgi:hypothetical protein
LTKIAIRTTTTANAARASQKTGAATVAFQMGRRDQCPPADQKLKGEPISPVRSVLPAFGLFSGYGLEHSPKGRIAHREAVPVTFDNPVTRLSEVTLPR